MIKTILFDLGNVIVSFDFKRAFGRLQPLCNYEVSDIPRRLRGTDLIHRFEAGEIGPRQFVADLCKVLDLEIDYDEFCSIWTGVFLPEPLISESLVRNLAGRYRLIIVSNTNPIHFGMIQRTYPLLQHFDDYVLSYEVGALKPDRKIYEAAVARAECSAGECFFTDDLAVNVQAAREHGMDAVQFLSAVQLERELQTRGLL